MKKRRIVVIGAGGHGREIAQLINDIAEDGGGFEIIGFVDDDISLTGKVIAGLPVLGELSWLTEQPEIAVAVGVGKPAVKQALLQRLSVQRTKVPELIHPSALLGRRISVGAGVQICAGCILTTDISLGSMVTLNRGCHISHDCVIGAFASLHPAVALAGNVSVGEGAELGIGSCSIQGRTIGAWSVVGAGAVITRDVREAVTVVGVPAREVSPRI